MFQLLYGLSQNRHSLRTSRQRLGLLRKIFTVKTISFETLLTSNLFSNLQFLEDAYSPYTRKQLLPHQKNR